MVVSEGGLAMLEFLMDGIGDHIHILTADSIWWQSLRFRGGLNRNN